MREQHGQDVGRTIVILGEEMCFAVMGLNVSLVLKMWTDLHHAAIDLDDAGISLLSDT